MTRSQKKTSNASEMMDWLASIPGRWTDPRVAVLEFIRTRTLQAFRENEYRLLPTIYEIADTVRMGRTYASQVTLGLLRDGTLARMKDGAKFRYHVTKEWLE